tara:strand:+ start:5632 stop:6816 length:1185 start_codon:yes stop_codon:yes gene_type:complete
MNNNFNYYLPTKIIAGRGQINELGEQAKIFGEKLLLITPKSLSHINSSVIQQLKDDKFNLTIEEVCDKEPTITYINKIANLLRGNEYDVIIGFGGGSAIDVAKALSIALTHTEDIWLYANLSNRPPLPLKQPLIPVIAIPTTSGTGAEVTPYAVLTKEDTFQKGTIQEVEIFPKVAIIDPELIISLPPSLTASTGLDAFAHALEASINISKYSPVAETFGKSAMRIILKWLPIAVKEPENINARMKVAWASCLAGISIAHRGTTTAHSIAEPLGGLTNIQHGLAVSLSTLPVMRHTIHKDPKCLAKLNNTVLGLSSQNDKAAAENFFNVIEDMFVSLSLNKCVNDFLPKEKFKDLDKLLIENVLKFKFRPLLQHPVVFNDKSLKPIIHELINGN